MAEYPRGVRPVLRVPLVLDLAGEDAERAQLALRAFVALVSGDAGDSATHREQVLDVLQTARAGIVGGAVYGEQRRRVTEPPKPSAYVPWMDGVLTLSGAPMPTQLEIEQGDT